MRTYLSKKIAIPNGTKLHSLAWNPDQGWIACGGADGLMKVLKLDSPTAPKDGGAGAGGAGGGKPAGSNLSMNQTLDGHEGSVMCVTWNANYSKLTTSDGNGLIIVWMLHQGMWYEEMINNRNKSVVRDMKWTSDGQKICIIYEDGAVIVGSVDGNRLWGKELDVGLRKVEWAPDGKRILFVCSAGKVHIFDAGGNRIKGLALDAVQSTSNKGEGKSGGGGSDDDDSDDDTGESKQNADATNRGNQVVSIDWYDGAEGHMHQDAPTLAVALANGRVQLTRGADELTREDSGGRKVGPVIIDSRLKLRQAKWNTNGTVLALTGNTTAISRSGEKREMSMVKFYTPYGELLRTLKVPHSGVTGLSWEGGGLRIALAVEEFIYFANIRPDYQWGYAKGADMLCYAFQKPDRVETNVVFWDLRSDERHTKLVKDLKQLKAGGESAVMISGPTDVLGSHRVTLLDAIGNPLEEKSTLVQPNFVVMTERHVVVADKKVCYVWQYRTQPVAKLSALDIGSNVSKVLKRSSGKERIVDPQDLSGNPILTIDAYNRSQAVAEEGEGGSSSGSSSGSSKAGGAKGQGGEASSSICAVAASDRLLVIALDNGQLQCYSLPHLAVEAQYTVRCVPAGLSLNCNSSLLSIVDDHGMLTIFDFAAERRAKGGPGVGDDDELDFGVGVGGTGVDGGGGMGGPGGGKTQQQQQQQAAKKVDWSGFERKDAWDMVWSCDDPLQFAVTEKTKTFVFHGDEPEEARPNSGYMCSFEDMEVKLVRLDEVMMAPEAVERSMVSQMETRQLKNLRELINTSGVTEGLAFVTAAQPAPPHPKLWRCLAQAALEVLDFGLADKAFVHCADYQGIHFVQRVAGLTDRMKQRAEVAAYFLRYDEAESLYREIDRKDLAIDLRQRLGDWLRVVHLVKQGGGDDQQLQRAWSMIGEHYADRSKWTKAMQYYKQARSLDKQADCFYRLEEYQHLSALVEALPPGSAELLKLGSLFQGVGLAGEAVNAYVRGGDPKAAIDACVLLNQWSRAVDLAAEFDFPQIEGLLSKYALQLLERGEHLRAVELYRKANKATDAALLLAKLAEESGRVHVNPLRAKKLHVLAALEVERHRKHVLNLTSSMTRQGGKTAADVATATAVTLDTLMATGDSAEDKQASKVLDNAWRGAEAYHYYMLAQRQLYQGQIEMGMKTAIRCAEYEDILPPWDIYSLVAVAAYHCGYFGVCSRAFVKLQTLPQESVSKDQLEAVQALAVSIFTKHEPHDPTPDGSSSVGMAADGNSTTGYGYTMLPQQYLDCLDEGRSYMACTVSGQLITSKARSIMCKACKRFAVEAELRNIANCPLCHASMLS